jgi:hypothetical protein
LGELIVINPMDRKDVVNAVYGQRTQMRKLILAKPHDRGDVREHCCVRTI